MNTELWHQRWPAPAKLNLMLRIVGRRSDGYHLLQTVFQIIDYCDYLKFSIRDDQNIVIDTPIPGVKNEDNLIVRAALLLRAKADELEIQTTGITISITKNLPMGGGLGGGSSDAATTLVALNLLWDLKLSDHIIAAMGLELGADVPVFTYGYSSWAEGVGENLKPMCLPDEWFVVIVPDCHVSTGEVFSHSGLTRNSESITMDEFSAHAPYNDCKPVVSETYPEVKRALDALAIYPVSGLTGTGGCVFASFSSELEANKEAAMLMQHWNVFVAKAVNCSPLHRMTAAHM